MDVRRRELLGQYVFERRKRNNYLAAATHFYQASNGQTLTPAEKERAGLPRPPDTRFVVCLLLEPPPAVADKSYQPTTEQEHRGRFGDLIHKNIICR